MTAAQLIAKFNARFGFEMPDDSSLHFLARYCRLVGAVDMAVEMEDFSRAGK